MLRSLLGPPYTATTILGFREERLQGVGLVGSGTRLVERDACHVDSCCT